MRENFLSPEEYVQNITDSGLTIYDTIEIGDPDLWIPTPVLESLLEDRLVGTSLHGLPLRTRSKVVKEHVCRALGYPIPSSFKKTQPRFIGQQFDTYIQKANNLQIWNEEVSLSRRYVIIKVTSDDVIDRIRVVTGDIISALDTTGTLTQKYQARLIKGDVTTELVISEDTENIKGLVIERNDSAVREQEHPTVFYNRPIDQPSSKFLLPIRIIFQRLSDLRGTSFPDTGFDQERNRGAQLHRIVAGALGYKTYQDAGQFPDIPHQLLEVKLQTSPTIDLGLVKPDSQEFLNIGEIEGRKIRHCDIRYALFYAETDGIEVQLTHFYLTTGEAFFTRFPQFQGKVVNKKIQIPLPSDFFDRESERLPY